MYVWVCVGVVESYLVVGICSRDVDLQIGGSQRPHVYGYLSMGPGKYDSVLIRNGRHQATRLVSYGPRDRVTLVADRVRQRVAFFRNGRRVGSPLSFEEMGTTPLYPCVLFGGPGSVRVQYPTFDYRAYPGLWETADVDDPTLVLGPPAAVTLSP